jgi:acyl carrier protein
VEPRTEDEAALARIWVEVLKVERVGVRDNFFDLGGHSLLATQVISRVRDGFGVELRLQTLFELPTVETLAQAVAAGREAGGGGARGVQAITRRSKSIEQQLAELEGLSGGAAEATTRESGRGAT